MQIGTQNFTAFLLPSCSLPLVCGFPELAVNNVILHCTCKLSMFCHEALQVKLDSVEIWNEVRLREKKLSSCFLC